DLVDRGPDSVRVVDIVQRLVQAGVASAILGNHELNILLEEEKEGNGWFNGHVDGWWNGGVYLPFPSRSAEPDERKRILSFLETLPVALESSSLRIVHAAWEPEAIAKAQQATNLREFRAAHAVDLSGIDLSDAPSKEALLDPSVPIAFHAGLAE